MTTGATLFSGGGVGEALLRDIVDIKWAVEYDPAIADVYRRNYGDHVIVGDVRAVDYAALPRVDWLHASPVCTRASVANSGATESDEDMQTAEAVVRALEAVQPRAFTLENVWPYREFAAFRRICQALSNLGYWFEFSHLNAADYGVPQTRRRLILRATRDRLLPTLPEPVKWVGWYAAIEDLIPTLPETQFAPWQLARLPEEIKGAALLMQSRTADRGPGVQHREYDQPGYTVDVNGAPPKAFIISNAKTEYGDGVVWSDEPALSVTQQQNGRLRAFLVQGTSTLDVRGDGAPSAAVMATVGAKAAMPKALLIDGDNAGREMTVLDADDPAMSLRAGRVVSHRAWLAAGRVVKVTPRALARFQSLPDTYWLPEKASLATRVIGNGVPALLMRRVVEQLI